MVAITQKQRATQQQQKSTKAMFFNLSAKSLAGLTILLALGAASTTASHLRERRQAALFGHHEKDGDGEESSSMAASTVTKPQLRGAPASVPASASAPASAPASASADDVDEDEESLSLEEKATDSEEEGSEVGDDEGSEDEDTEEEKEEEPSVEKKEAVDPQVAAAAAAEPSITTDKTTYAQGEPITVTFSVGSSSHPYFKSAEAPSRHVDRNYPEWKVGLFMRDADPQGGRLDPIVSIKVCQGLKNGCADADRSYVSYGQLTVTFGGEEFSTQGRWPLEVNRYGTGFDAYLLDGQGAGAVGPLEFYVQKNVNEDVDTMHKHGKGGPAVYRLPQSTEEIDPEKSAEAMAPRKKRNPLMKYQKGTARATERQHAAMSRPSGVGAEVGKANAWMAGTNGLEVVNANLLPESKGDDSADIGPSPGSLVLQKQEFETGEDISIAFTIPTSALGGGKDLSSYRVGIFKQNRRPGSNPPVVSLPMCPEGKCGSANGFVTGTVAFAEGSDGGGEGWTWPISAQEWGTEFDAYALDGEGKGVSGPVKFRIMKNDTY